MYNSGGFILDQECPCDSCTATGQLSKRKTEIFCSKACVMSCVLMLLAKTYHNNLPQNDLQCPYLGLILMKCQRVKAQLCQLCGGGNYKNVVNENGSYCSLFSQIVLQTVGQHSICCLVCPT